MTDQFDRNLPAPAAQPPAAYQHPQSYTPYPAQYGYPPGTPYPARYGYPQHPVHVSIHSTVPPKNAGVALLLTFLFGPLGMLYSTVTGGLVMIGINTMVLILGFFTFGIAWIGFFFTWIAGLVWAYTAAEDYNRKLGGRY
jgi:hypothetical protein